MPSMATLLNELILRFANFISVFSFLFDGLIVCSNVEYPIGAINTIVTTQMVISFHFVIDDDEKGFFKDVVDSVAKKMSMSNRKFIPFIRDPPINWIFSHIIRKIRICVVSRLFSCFFWKINPKNNRVRRSVLIGV